MMARDAAATVAQAYPVAPHLWWQVKTTDYQLITVFITLVIRQQAHSLTGTL